MSNRDHGFTTTVATSQTRRHDYGLLRYATTAARLIIFGTYHVAGNSRILVA